VFIHRVRGDYCYGTRTTSVALLAYRHTSSPALLLSRQLRDTIGLIQHNKWPIRDLHSLH
jgi:hypothetical protein